MWGAASKTVVTQNLNFIPLLPNVLRINQLYIKAVVRYILKNKDYLSKLYISSNKDRANCNKLAKLIAINSKINE